MSKYSDGSKGENYASFGIITGERIINCNINTQATIFTAESRAIREALSHVIHIVTELWLHIFGLQKYSTKAEKDTNNKPNFQ